MNPSLMHWLFIAVDKNHSIDILTTPLQQEDGWRLLIPAGHFRAVDGRPHEPELTQGWYLDESLARNLIDQVAARGQDMVVDYEHATLHAKEKGTPAPASGWLDASEMRWTELGLWIRPRWTNKAAAELDSQEYRFLSPCIGYHKTTGHVVDLYHASLTNDPGITGMNELTRLARLQFAPPPNEDVYMNQETLLALLKKLLGAAGVELTDDLEANVSAAIDAINQKSTSQTELTAKLDQATAALSSQKPAEVDLTQYVPVATYNALMAEITALSSQNTTLTVDQIIEDGRKDGRIMAREVDYLKQLGAQQGTAVLSSFIEARAPIAGLTGMQTPNIPSTDPGKKTAALSSAQKEAARLLGKSEKEYQALVQAETAE